MFVLLTLHRFHACSRILANYCAIDSCILFGPSWPPYKSLVTMHQLTGVTLFLLNPVSSSSLILQQFTKQASVLDNKDKVSPCSSSTLLMYLYFSCQMITRWLSYAVGKRNRYIWNNPSAPHIFQNHIEWKGDASSEMILHASVPCMICARINTTPPNLSSAIGRKKVENLVSFMHIGDAVTSSCTASCICSLGVWCEKVLDNGAFWCLFVLDDWWFDFLFIFF